MIPARYRVEPSEIEIRPHVEQGEAALSGVVDSVRRHLLLLGSCVAVCLALGVAYTYYSTPVYEASAVVRFEAERLDLPELVQLPYTENLINTEMEVLKGRSAAAAVVDSLGLRARLLVPRRGKTSQLFSTLRVAADADSQTLVFHARKNGEFTVTRPDSITSLGVARVGDTVRIAGVLVGLAPAAKSLPELQLHVDPLEAAVASFSSSLDLARPTRDADLIAIRVRNSDPVRAAASANIMAINLIEERNRARRGRTGAAVTFLKQQDDSLGKQLRSAEESLRAYQQREHVIDVPQQASAEVTRLAKLQADLAGVRAERDAFASLVTQLKNDTSRGTPDGPSISRRLMAFPSLLANQSASVLLGALAQVETRTLAAPDPSHAGGFGRAGAHGPHPRHGGTARGDRASRISRA